MESTNFVRSKVSKEGRRVGLGVGGGNKVEKLIIPPISSIL
jgi:hypothetical protein